MYGGGQHGCLAIILDPNTCYTLIEEKCMALTNLCLVSIIAGTIRTATMVAEENVHKDYLCECKEFKAVSKAILQYKYYRSKVP